MNSHDEHSGITHPVLPNPPSVEAAYKRKCIELKKRLKEVETTNEELRYRNLRGRRYVEKMRLESCILLERLSVLMGMKEELMSVPEHLRQSHRVGGSAMPAGMPLMSLERPAPTPSVLAAMQQGQVLERLPIHERPSQASPESETNEARKRSQSHSQTRKPGKRTFEEATADERGIARDEDKDMDVDRPDDGEQRILPQHHQPPSHVSVQPRREEEYRPIAPRESPVQPQPEILAERERERERERELELEREREQQQREREHERDRDRNHSHTPNPNPNPVPVSVSVPAPAPSVETQSFRIPPVRPASPLSRPRDDGDSDEPRPTYISVSAPAPPYQPPSAARSPAPSAAPASGRQSQGHYVSAFEDFTNRYRNQVRDHLLARGGAVREEEVDEILNNHWVQLKPEEKRQFGDRRYDSR